MIKDLKELQSLLKLCRKEGITEITLDGTVIKFGEMPGKSRSKRKKAKAEKAEEQTEIPTEGLTPEQLIYYSARPHEVSA